MITLKKPLNLNGSELRAELRLAGVFISDNIKAIEDDNKGQIILDIADTDKDKAEIVVVAHNGTMITPEPTVANKLASVGLSIEELKAALGSN